MKRSTAFALTFALSAASLSAALATEDGAPATHPIHHHHRVHHRLPAVRDAVAPPVVVAQPPAAQALGLSWPRFAPYPDNKGDEDGLSEDQNDCNKGCIDGNPG